MTVFSQPASAAIVQERPENALPDEAITCSDNAASWSDSRQIELEDEVNALCQRLGEALRYPRETGQAVQLGETETENEQSNTKLGLITNSACSQIATQKLNVQLRQSEERYRGLFEAVSEGFCIIEKVEETAGALLDFRYVEANAAFLAQSQITEIIGKTIREIAPDESEECFGFYKSVLLTGKPIRFQRTLVAQKRVLELYAFRVCDNEMNARVAVNCHDITERKKNEELLRSNRDTFFNLIQNAPFGLYIVDSAFCLCQISIATQKVFSDINPLIGRDFGEVLHILWPEDFANRVMKQFRYTLQTGKPYAAKNTNELRHNTANVESYDWKIERISLPDGQFGVVCYFYDVTERQTAENALRESEEFNRSIVRSSSDCIEILDLKGNLISIESGEGLFGSNGLQLYSSKPWVEHWEGKDRLAAQAAITSAANKNCNDGSKKRNFVGLSHTPLGESVWRDVLVSPILDANGEPARLLAVSRDVTQRKQAENVLIFRTSQFETLLNEAPLGIYLVDEDFSICHANPIARHVFGNKADLIGTNLNQALRFLWSETDADEISDRFWHTLKTGDAYIESERAEERIDLEVTEYYEWQINRISLLDGRNGVVCYFRDISERVLAQKKIHESEERYRNLFNSMDEGFCIVQMIFDSQNEPVDFQFLEVNPAFYEQTGVYGVVGKRMLEIAPKYEKNWFEIFGKVALTGDAHRFVNETKALKDRWFDVYATRIGEPETRKVAVIFNNITQRKSDEEALRQSEQRFRALFDLGPIAMYSCDATGMIQEFNRRAVTLWGRVPERGNFTERFCGSWKLWRPDGTPLTHSETPLAAALRGEICDLNDVEVLIERPDGSRITIIANVVALKSAQGAITGAMCCFYDITERSNLEQKTQEQAQALYELHRRKDEFLAMLSHELRSPLAPISNAVQLLRLQKCENPLQKQARQIIERQVAQLKHLVDDLLEVSRITSGRVLLRSERVAVSDIADRAVEAVQPLIVQHGHQLEVLLPQQPVWLCADAARLEQVVVNLLTNAAKYTYKGGRIWLTILQEENSVVIKVRDTGIGIAPALLPRIFDLFTQAERSLDRADGGLGIGLSLVQQLVSLHGGTVVAQSVEGEGSEFVVRLPAIADLVPTPAPLLTPPSVQTAMQSKKYCKVLVVDDNIDAAQSLAMLLEMSGHEIQMAFCGLTALETAINWSPDVMLLDIGLPGLNGFEVAERIRQHPLLTNTVLVALTGYGQKTDRQQSEKSGFDHHLAKPANFHEIEKILENVAAVVQR